MKKLIVAVSIAILLTGCMTEQELAQREQLRAEEEAFHKWALQHPGEAAKIRAQNQLAQQQFISEWIRNTTPQFPQQQRFQTNCQFVGNMMTCF